MAKSITKEEFLKIDAIVKRAEDMGLTREPRWVHMLDLENAHKQFNLRLDEFLHAEDYDFGHDFLGVWRYINRETFLVEGLFVPRFAGEKD